MDNISVDKRGRCSIAHRALRQIPFPAFNKVAPNITELDASHNNLSDVGVQIDMFVNLEGLILDHNRVQSQIKLSKLPKLKLLYCNSNQIKNLSVFIEKVAEAFPNLKILSLMNNDACPNFFNGGSMEQYEDYRLFVISRFPQLQTLDISNVSADERKRAKEVYGNLTIKPMVKLQEEAEMKKKLAAQQKLKEEQELKLKQEREEQERLAKLLQEQEMLNKQKQKQQNVKPNINVPKNLPDVNAPPPPSQATLSRSNSSASVKQAAPAKPVIPVPQNLPPANDDSDDEEADVAAALPAPITPPESTSAQQTRPQQNVMSGFAPTPMLIAARIASRQQKEQQEAAEAANQAQQKPKLPPPRRAPANDSEDDDD